MYYVINFEVVSVYKSSGFYNVFRRLFKATYNDKNVIKRLRFYFVSKLGPITFTILILAFSFTYVNNVMNKIRKDMINSVRCTYYI